MILKTCVIVKYRDGQGEGNGTPLQYSCLENPMGGGAWQAAVHGVTKSDATDRLHFHFSFSYVWRRKWQPTPVFLPGESQGRGSLVGCRLQGHTESDTTETIQQQQHGCLTTRMFTDDSFKIEKYQKQLNHSTTVNCDLFWNTMLPLILSPFLAF